MDHWFFHSINDKTLSFVVILLTVLHHRFNETILFQESECHWRRGTNYQFIKSWNFNWTTIFTILWCTLTHTHFAKCTMADSGQLKWRWSDWVWWSEFCMGIFGIFCKIKCFNPSPLKSVLVRHTQIVFMDSQYGCGLSCTVQ